MLLSFATILQKPVPNTVPSTVGVREDILFGREHSNMSEMCHVRGVSGLEHPEHPEHDHGYDEHHITLINASDKRHKDTDRSATFHMSACPRFHSQEHHIALEEVAFLSKKAPNKSTSKTFVHRYLMREALMNRAVFLCIMALIVIFIVLVVNGGAINNMEWIRNNILASANGKWQALRQDTILPLSNILLTKSPHQPTHIDPSSGADSSAGSGAISSISGDDIILVVWAVQSISDLEQPDMKFALDSMQHHMNALNLNCSAAVYFERDSWTSFSRTISMQGWVLGLLDEKNASSPIELVSFLLDKMHVGVLYLDVGMYAQQERRVFSMLEYTVQRQYTSSGLEENLLLIPAANESTMATIEQVIDTPSIPLFNAGMILVRHSHATQNLWGDAAAKMAQDRQMWNRSVAVSTFLLNMLVNDGRPCVNSDIFQMDDALVSTTTEGQQKDAVPTENASLPSNITPKQSVLDGYRDAGNVLVFHMLQ